MGLFRPQPGQTVGRRYLRAIGLNFKGLLWCAIILLLAAIYEAVEILLIVSKG
jgi:hypothetical protein